MTRLRPLVVVLALAAASCSSSHKSTSSDPLAALRAAAKKSLATSSATFHGVMAAGGDEQVVVTGAVDFVHRTDSIKLSPARDAGTYPPYESRFVDGWNYVEIDSAVRRPPTVRANAKWIAFQQALVRLPVPDRTLRPQYPLDAIALLLTQPSAEAHFVARVGTEPRRASVRFRQGKYSNAAYTYAIDGNGRIVSVSELDQYDQSVTLAFLYGPGRADVVAPTRGVQRLTPGENLYPTPTSAPTA